MRGEDRTKKWIRGLTVIGPGEAASFNKTIEKEERGGKSRKGLLTRNRREVSRKSEKTSKTKSCLLLKKSEQERRTQCDDGRSNGCRRDWPTSVEVLARIRI